MNVRIVPVGDTGLVVMFEQEISRKTGTLVRSLSLLLEEKKKSIKGIIEIVPTFCTVMVYYDCLTISSGKLTRIINEAVSRCGEEEGVASSKCYEIPVCYEGDFAPDMKNVELHTGLSAKEIIRRHTEPNYMIYMLGFLPGFAYLGGLDEKLETPRLDSPRTKIPAGAVGIGGNQTGIYPLDSPGGWQLIGRTPVKPYDAKRDKPVLYEAGEFIHFCEISLKEYEDISKAVDSGSYVCKTFDLEEKL